MDQPWQMALFKRSLKKKQTLAAILANLPDVDGKRCLEIGCATGLTSYFLRARGGSWISADFEEDHVRSTRQLVGGEVLLLDEKSCLIDLPSETFDLVVGINFLEHLQDDRLFLSEMARVMKPGATFILTGPRGERRRLAYLLKKMYGFTADRGGFGHVRDGYPPRILERLLEEAGLQVEFDRSYSKFFTETVEDTLNYLYHSLSSKRKESTSDFHGSSAPMSGDAFQKVSLPFRMYALFFPVFRLITMLDKLLFWSPGYMFIARAGK